jgi:hypothetical protein
MRWKQVADFRNIDSTVYCGNTIGGLSGRYKADRITMGQTFGPGSDGWAVCVPFHQQRDGGGFAAAVSSR